MTPPWRNREGREFFIGLLVAGILIGAAAGPATLWVWREAGRQAEEARLAALGRVAITYPDRVGEVAPLLLPSASRPEEVAAGRAVAAQYGYGNWVGGGGGAYGSHPAPPLLLSGAVLLLALVAAGWLAVGAFSRLYGHARSLTLAADRMMRGDFSARFPEQGEGDLPALGAVFNHLSSRLQSSMERLSGESRFMKEFLSDISHQIKTPLSSLRMFNDLLQTPLSPERRQAFLVDMGRQIDRIESLLQQLLRIARVEAGVLPMERVEGDLRATLSDAVHELRPRAEQRGQRLTLSLPPHPVVCAYDPAWLTEALLNLIKNGIDYTQAEGRIEVTLTESRALITITVADDGPGIPEAELAHIFERFCRGSRAGGAGGSGLGLALARLIAEKHGGLVGAENRAPRGALFTVILPRDREPYGTVRSAVTGT